MSNVEEMAAEYASDVEAYVETRKKVQSLNIRIASLNSKKEMLFKEKSKLETSILKDLGFPADSEFNLDKVLLKVEKVVSDMRQARKDIEEKTKLLEEDVNTAERALGV